MEELREYSENDVLALGYIWITYVQTMASITGLSRQEVLKCPTTPSLTWKTIVGKIEEEQMPEQYMDQQARKFLRKTIHGGRCIPYVRYIKAGENQEPLVAFDKNSLYPDVMQSVAEFSDVRDSTHITPE